MPLRLFKKSTELLNTMLRYCLSVCLCFIFLTSLGVDKTYEWLTENYYGIA